MATIPDADHSLDHETQVPTIIGILTFCSVLSTTVVALRVYTRTHLLHAFGIDDATMVFAQIMTLAVAATIYLEAHYGLGRHIWTMPPEYVHPYMKTFYASIVIYNFDTPLVKIAILLQFKRLFPSRTMQRICAVALVFMSAYAIAFPLTLALSCTPVAKFWDGELEGTCISQRLADPIMGSINICTDIFLLILPMPNIKSLQLPRKQKLMLAGVFCLSFFTIGIALYRIKPLVDSTNTVDPTWTNVGAAYWSYLEVTMGTLAACLPTLRPLLVKILPSANDTTHDQSKEHKHSADSSGDWIGHQADAAHGDFSFRDSLSTSQLHEKASDPDLERGEGHPTRPGKVRSTSEYHASVQAGRFGPPSPQGPVLAGNNRIKATTTVEQTVR